MKKPTLKEVQEHFKNAKEVKSSITDEIFTLEHPIYFNHECFDNNNKALWSLIFGYSEIITKKPGGQILDYPRKRLQVTVPLKIYDTCMSLVDAEILKFKNK